MFHDIRKLINTFEFMDLLGVDYKASVKKI